jgi:hypothetical protein
MAQATHDYSRFHNLSNEALADAIGQADLALKAHEAEVKALKDEFKNRGLLTAAGEHGEDYAACARRWVALMRITVVTFAVSKRITHRLPLNSGRCKPLGIPMPSREPQAAENSSHPPRQAATADTTTTTPSTVPATTPSLPRPRRRLRPTLQTRRRIENAIELMINALDELDREFEEREPSLGAPDQMNQADAWHRPGNREDASSISGCRSAPVRCSAILLSAAETAAKKRMNTPEGNRVRKYLLQFDEHPSDPRPLAN